jgi:hypothetical protein
LAAPTNALAATFSRLSLSAMLPLVSRMSPTETGNLVRPMSGFSRVLRDIYLTLADEAGIGKFSTATKKLDCSFEGFSPEDRTPAR